jgi:hypothetical protein
MPAGHLLVRIVTIDRPENQPASAQAGARY